jgi:hypothetical protein
LISVRASKSNHERAPERPSHTPTVGDPSQKIFSGAVGKNIVKKILLLM